jgi:hypothetical protein
MGKTEAQINAPARARENRQACGQRASGVQPAPPRGRSRLRLECANARSMSAYQARNCAPNNSQRINRPWSRPPSEPIAGCGERARSAPKGPPRARHPTRSRNWNFSNLWYIRRPATERKLGAEAPMLSTQLVFPGLAQVPCAFCGHPRGIHRNSEGACSVFCGCRRWTPPAWWDLLNNAESD